VDTVILLKDHEKWQVIPASAAKAPTKYSRVVKAARFQPSAVSAKFLNKYRE